ncbi:uncharacterized protein BP5553_00435 [Venustampulla echinocandica]|uniref:Uncharacterized protein n=1 Tax=Venustampulla echinocandica TaxID=2656787 RepID=A0A370TY51_9HELO|nr:uncharacterized protein BP5553_00435 [Venustampulla echinocandica]RDL40456.1 hypothetical protein BP5553_00435 [Venustampulla echinocandica]
MTTAYNVYRVKFSQISGTDHGNVGMGMDYDARPGYKFASDRSYSGKECAFQLPVEKLQGFEAIASAQTPPYDSRVLMTRDVKSLDPPAPDCTTWVEEVLAAAQKL